MHYTKDMAWNEILNRNFRILLNVTHSDFLTNMIRIERLLLMLNVTHSDRLPSSKRLTT